MKITSIKSSILMLGFALFMHQPVSADVDKVRKSLSHSMPSIEIDSIEPSAITGLYEVIVDSNIFYVSTEGQYLIQGHMIDLKAREDLTEKKLGDLRKVALDKMGTGKMIVFKPEKSQHTVSVFTDIDCGYCRKLHAEMEKYLDNGITVQYLFYPRAGKGSDSYNKAVSVWCSADRNQALTDAKNGKNPEPKECDNPIDQHMSLAADFEVRGTPMIVTDKGTVFPGYVPADRLKKALEIE